MSSVKRSALAPALLLGLSVACDSTATAVLGPPTVPVITSLTPGDGTVMIRFDHASAVGTVPAQQFSAECREVGGESISSATAASSPIVVTGLLNGHVYSCAVIAMGDGLASSPSEPIIVTPAALPGLVAEKAVISLLTPGNGAATANFDLPYGYSQLGYGADISMTCNAGQATKTATMTNVRTVVVPITVTGLQNGFTYSCVLRAKYTSSGIVDSSKAVQVAPGTPVRPLAPHAVFGNQAVSVSFQPSTDNGSPVSSYTATCSSDGLEARTGSAPASPVVVTGLANGVLYACSLFATNAVGPGQTIGVSGVAGRPTVPTDVAATIGVGSATFTFGAPESDNGAPIVSYDISCTSHFAGSPIFEYATASGPGSPITVSGLGSRKPWDCSVAARNANGLGPAAKVAVTMP